MTRLIEAALRRTSLARGALFTRASWPLLIACAAGCYKLDDDDHRLQETGGLFSLYADASDTCLPCLREHCRPDAIDCANEAGCKKAMECQGAANPAAYRKCLNEMYAMDASAPDDENGAWEGEKGTLRRCIDNNCQAACNRNVSDWTCRGSWSFSKGYEDREFDVSVESYTQGVRQNVIVQRCTKVTDCDDVVATTNHAGTALIAAPKGSEELYLKITPGTSGINFPPTYYYPAHLGTEPRQPLSAVVISTELFWIAHRRLGLEVGVFKDLAHSLILPDGCREQSLPSATHVTVHLEGWSKPMPECRGDETATRLLQRPCVWYADESGTANPGQDHTMGKGAGILGLDEGTYVVRVCDRENKQLLARREVRMEPGALTVARTWPLTREEMADAGEDCFLNLAPPE